MKDTASPSPIASENIDPDHTSESRGALPPAVPGNLLVPTIVQNALGGFHATYNSTYSQDPQVLSLAAVQTQPPVPGAQGFDTSPMTWAVSSHDSTVRQQPPMLHEYTRAFSGGGGGGGGGGGLAYANTGPTRLGGSLNGNDWTGTLGLNCTCAHVRAQGRAAVSNPYAPAISKGRLVGD